MKRLTRSSRTRPKSGLNYRSSTIPTSVTKAKRPSKLDPTQSRTLRRQFAAKINKQFARLRFEVVKLIADEDALGLMRQGVFNERTKAAVLVELEDTAEFDRVQALLDPADVLKLEDDSHITVFYGLIGDQYDAVCELMQADAPIGATIGRLSLFESADVDALKFDVFSPQLRELHRKLSLLPNEQTRSEYLPHMTVAYLKPGKGVKYLDLLSSLVGEQVLFPELVYAPVEGDNLTVNLAVSEMQRRYLNAQFGHVWVKEHHFDNRGKLPYRVRKGKRIRKPKRVDNVRWMFATDPEKLKQFQLWLQSQIAINIAGKTEEELWKAYILQGFKKGIAKSTKDVTKREAVLDGAFVQPVGYERVQMLAMRAFEDLQNVATDMATKMQRVLVDGLIAGDNPRKIAKGLADQVDLSKERALLISRTEVIRAHAEGQLTALESLGIDEVTAAVEWSTAGDGRVCPRCSKAAGVVLKVSEARGMIPLHPNCRCAWLPAITQREGQKRSKTAIERALPDAEVDKLRPELLALSAALNVFCPTGEGGGVDPHCKKGLDAAPGLRAVHDSLPPYAKERIAQNLSAVHHYASTKELGLGIVHDALSRIPEGHPDRADVERLKQLVQSDKKTMGGAVVWHPGTEKGALHVDGDYREAKQTAEEVHAHELFHLVDGFENKHSGSKAWQKAHDAESHYVSKYARTHDSESFAEFGRLVYGAKMDLADLEQHHPLMSKYFKENGLWPKSSS